MVSLYESYGIAITIFRSISFVIHLLLIADTQDLLCCIDLGSFVCDVILYIPCYPIDAPFACWSFWQKVKFVINVCLLVGGTILFLILGMQINCNTGPCYVLFVSDASYLIMLNMLLLCFAMPPDQMQKRNPVGALADSYGAC